MRALLNIFSGMMIEFSSRQRIEKSVPYSSPAKKFVPSKSVKYGIKPVTVTSCLPETEGLHYKRYGNRLICIPKNFYDFSPVDAIRNASAVRFIFRFLSRLVYGFICAWTLFVPWTFGAVRFFGNTNKRTEFHQGLIPFVRFFSGQNAAGQSPLIPGFYDRWKDPSENAPDIGIDDGDILSESKTCYCMRRIRTDAGQCQQCINFIRHFTPIIADDDSGEFSETQCPHVISHSSPCTDHFSRGCRSER